MMAQLEEKQRALSDIETKVQYYVHDKEKFIYKCRLGESLVNGHEINKEVLCMCACTLFDFDLACNLYSILSVVH